MIKSKLRLFGWAVGLSLALGAVGAVAAQGAPVETKAALQTATINFGSASGSTKVDGTSVDGNDSAGVTWTVTTVMEAESFTQNAEYSQIGASKKPATSITLTATLDADYKITSFYSKWGGFSGTAGSIEMSVGTTEVATGSLNASSDVEIQQSTGSYASGVEGNSLTITVTGISKGVKLYQVSYAYETPSVGPVASSVSIDDVENNEIEVYEGKATEFTADYVLGDDGVSLRWSVSDEDCIYTLSSTSGASTTFTATTEGSALLTVEVLDESSNPLASDYVLITAVESPYVFGSYTQTGFAGMDIESDFGPYFHFVCDGSGTTPTNYTTALRIYNNDYITISTLAGSHVYIESINFVATTNSKSITLSNATGSWTSQDYTISEGAEETLDLWTAPENCTSATFSVSGAGQFRPQSIIVNYMREKVPSITVGGSSTVNASATVSGATTELALTTEFVDLSKCTISGASGYGEYVTPTLDAANSKLRLAGVKKTASPVAVYIKLNETILFTANVTVSDNVVSASVKPTIEVGENASITVSSSEYPSDTFAFVSGDSTVASVSAAGVVRGEKIGGPVTITVTSNTDGSSTTVTVTVVKATTHISKAGTAFDFANTSLPENWSGTTMQYFSKVQSLQSDGAYTENDKIAPATGSLRVIKVSLHALTSTGTAGDVKIELLKNGEAIEGTARTVTTTLIKSDADTVVANLANSTPLVVYLENADFNGIRLSGTSSSKVALGELTLSYFESVAEEADAWADEFVGITDGHCSGASNTVAAVWDDASAAYVKYTNAAKGLFTSKITAVQGASDGTKLGNAAARYYWAVTGHGHANTDFASSGINGALNVIGAKDNARTPLLVAAFAGIGALAVGGMVFLRKRKEL